MKKNEKCSVMFGKNNVISKIEKTHDSDELNPLILYDTVMTPLLYTLLIGIMERTRVSFGPRVLMFSCRFVFYPFFLRKQRSETGAVFVHDL